MSVVSNGQPSSTETAAPDSLLEKLRVTGEMIKFGKDEEKQRTPKLGRTGLMGVMDEDR